MERPLPFQPADPRHPAGWMLSACLHLALVLAAFLYLMQRPLLPPPPILPVELVTMQPAPAMRPMPRIGTPAPATRAPRATAVPPQESVQPEEDALTAKLQALSHLRAPEGPLTLGNGGGGNGGGGGMSLTDFVRMQIMRRWMPVLTNRQRREQPVQLLITVTDKGEFSEVTILDRQDFDGNLLYRSMAITARNAAVLTSPIAMPPGAWPKATTLTITLNPRDVSR
jgi:hypothetical protein